VELDVVDFLLLGVAGLGVLVLLIWLVGVIFP
jgi:hypothetical protein